MIVLKPSFADQGTRNSKLGKLSAWTEVARGPYRPMNTTVLNDNVKFQVILDINKYIVKPKGDATLEMVYLWSILTYIDLSIANWYAFRGFPYRDGYLLHSPLGTGDTSLISVLTGVFVLNVYMFSLLAPTPTDEKLGLLFVYLTGDILYYLNISIR
ncbi:mitochondrial chaperone bcs1 protein [Rutstroemia sp. NJR-2017a WRK4]|nr:mitochondrial chaperone bcs1 protein [Rutstroemia sp. NJR-2017a WRK4]